MNNFTADKQGDVTKPSLGQGKTPTITGSSKHVSTETSTLSVVMVTSTSSYSSSGVVDSNSHSSISNSNTGVSHNKISIENTFPSTSVSNLKTSSSEILPGTEKPDQHLVNADTFNVDNMNVENPEPALHISMASYHLDYIGSAYNRSPA